MQTALTAFYFSVGFVAFVGILMFLSWLEQKLEEVRQAKEEARRQFLAAFRCRTCGQNNTPCWAFQTDCTDCCQWSCCRGG